MTELYGLPQPITGAETVTLQQMQNGQIALCTMPLSALVAILGGNSTAWAANLQTTRPATVGVVWNNGGSISIS